VVALLGKVPGKGWPWHSLMGLLYHLLQKLSPEELADLKSSLVKHFMEGPGKASGVTCLYFVEEGQR
jgi:tRNA (uracil-5-)-methyltransferase